MSFDLHLQRFSAGAAVPSDPAPVAEVLGEQRHTGPDEFGFYNVEFADGVVVNFGATGLDGNELFSGCAFHVRGIDPQLIQFIFDVAQAGDFVIFNCQGANSPESPVLIMVNSEQGAHLPANLVAQYASRPICTSAKMLGTLLFPGYEGWHRYRDQVLRERNQSPGAGADPGTMGG